MKINCNYSVALCTYNGEKYIADQLNSILDQTIPPKEIIISDDGSKDHTLEIVKKVLENSFVVYKIVENEEVHGVTSNFNNAISLCTEQIIFTSDQDDIWIKNKAEVILKIFQNNEKALLVFTNGELVNQNLQPLNCDIWKSIGISEKIFEENRCFEYMLKRCFVVGATMAFKRELFLVNEKIPSSWLHDGWLTWKSIAKGAIVPCNKKLILYRQHGKNVVGMSSTISIKRIKNYFNNFKIIKDTHIIRYKRYVELKENMGYMFSDREKEELNKCISFWKDLVNSDESKKKLTRINIILKHIINGNFEKYFNGKKGAFREILSVFLNK
jgi:glycosyltransferase involved in cell wall biosynthesis